MRYVARIGKDGRITIPKALRDKLGIKPGDRVEFVFQDGELIMRRAG
jgi:AbrB family looped-hinge helix DNA binding protein